MSQIRRILIVDDDPLLRVSLAEQLGVHDDFVTVEAANAAEAMEAIRKGQLDLVIMDVGLPDADGREAVKKLRAEGFNKPVIMLTAHNSETDIVSGFELGGQRLRQQALSICGLAGANSRPSASI